MNKISFLFLAAICVVGISACTQKPPACDDTASADLVSGVFFDNLAEIYRAKGEDAVKRIDETKKKMTVSFSTIRTESYDNAAKKFVCKANFTLNLTNGLGVYEYVGDIWLGKGVQVDKSTITIPIEFSIQKIEQGKLYAQVTGLNDFIRAVANADDNMAANKLAREKRAAVKEAILQTDLISGQYYKNDMELTLKQTGLSVAFTFKPTAANRDNCAVDGNAEMYNVNEAGASTVGQEKGERDYYFKLDGADLKVTTYRPQACQWTEGSYKKRLTIGSADKADLSGEYGKKNAGVKVKQQGNSVEFSINSGVGQNVCNLEGKALMISANKAAYSSDDKADKCTTLLSFEGGGLNVSTKDCDGYCGVGASGSMDGVYQKEIGQKK